MKFFIKLTISLSSSDILNSCLKYPTRLFLSLIIFPESGFSSPAIILNNVVFPIPFNPIIPAFSPSSKEKLISFKTSFSL